MPGKGKGKSQGSNGDEGKIANSVFVVVMGDGEAEVTRYRLEEDNGGTLYFGKGRHVVDLVTDAVTKDVTQFKGQVRKSVFQQVNAKVLGSQEGETFQLSLSPDDYDTDGKTVPPQDAPEAEPSDEF